MKPMLYYGAILLATLSAAAYQVVQKNTPATAHPLLSIAVAYVIGAILCLLLIPIFPLSGSLGDGLRQLNWTTVALAITIIGIEVGYLLAFRAGWNIGVASLLSNTTVALLLIPVSVVWFREQLSFSQMAGIGFCLLGLVLVNRH